MVYCGKPSKGCSNCRERKIRCDQRVNGCGQCEKRQQQCPGYRNLVDLMFRDESSHVIKKAKARARKKGAANLTVEPATPSTVSSDGRLSLTPEPRSRALSIFVPATPVASSPAENGVWPYDDSLLMSPESGSWPVTPPAMARLYNLAPSCQEQGTAYFFSRYVNNEETACHQKFDFLRDVWKSSSTVPERQVDGVLASMTAVGLMGLASLTKSGDLMDAARKSYGTALGLTKDALKDPAEAVKDSTMLSILILGVFEMMVENPARDRTVQAFQEHVNGAVALARMRGPAQFQTRAGRRMFSMLCQRVIISCAQRDAPMPQPLIQLWHEMAKTLDPENPTKQLMPLVWQVLQLRSDIKQGNLADPEIIISQLLCIENEFEKLTTNMPLSWQYRTFKVTQFHPAVYGNYCHLYSSIHQANLWNCIRTTRILLLETIISEIYNQFYAFAPHFASSQYMQELNKARRKLKRVVADVAASVPQHIGLMDSDGTIESLIPGSTRIATVEVLHSPSPPTSPSSRSTDSGYSPSEPRRPSGLTILDVTKAQGEEESERYMHLVSATSTVVWPLYLVGMSTACTEEMKAYVIGRLRSLYIETSIKQADAIANILEEHETAPEWMDNEEGQERQDFVGSPVHMLGTPQSEDFGFVGLGLGLSPLQVPLPYDERSVNGNMNDLLWV
ncbi:sterol uptake control protein 2 [Podospora fimiseda]|uniref:Sterol uptake control protein 2 n=1 Tax=Podospora fimiseda TaxID=252190 RepID=A0AAN7H8B9_9PEZI|nr:sterol uptake control protein 2 [Podospora fimiseda]